MLEASTNLKTRVRRLHELAWHLTELRYRMLLIRRGVALQLFSGEGLVGRPRAVARLRFGQERTPLEGELYSPAELVPCAFLSELVLGGGYAWCPQIAPGHRFGLSQEKIGLCKCVVRTAAWASLTASLALCLNTWIFINRIVAWV